MKRSHSVAEPANFSRTCTTHVSVTLCELIAGGALLTHRAPKRYCGIGVKACFSNCHITVDENSIVATSAQRAGENSRLLLQNRKEIGPALQRQKFQLKCRETQPKLDVFGMLSDHGVEPAGSLQQTVLGRLSFKHIAWQICVVGRRPASRSRDALLDERGTVDEGKWP